MVAFDTDEPGSRLAAIPHGMDPCLRICGKAPVYDPEHGEVDEGDRGGSVILKAFGELLGTIDPGKSAFNRAMIAVIE
jgi:hypothetical protein